MGSYKIGDRVVIKKNTKRPESEAIIKEIHISECNKAEYYTSTVDGISFGPLYDSEIKPVKKYKSLITARRFR